MDYLHEIMNGYRSPVIKSDPMDLYNIFNFEDYNSNSRKVNYVTEVVDMIREFQSYSLRLWKFTDKPGSEKYEEYTQKKGELLSEINKRTYNPSTLLYLFRRLNEDKTLRPYIITILFNIGNQDAFDLIKRSKQPISLLEEDENGDIDLYGVHYRKKTQKIQEDGINEDIDNEEKIVEDDLNRYLETIDDENTQKEFEDFEKHQDNNLEKPTLDKTDTDENKEEKDK